MKQSLYTLATRFVTEMKAICRTLTAKKLNLTTQPSTKVKRGNPIQYGAVLFVAMLMAACSGKQHHSDERIITVTIEPIRYFTEQIAGDKFKVVSMVPGGSSPETYDPTPQQLVHLAGSEVYFRIGYIGFEQTWMQRLVENAPQMEVFDLSKGISLIKEEAHQHGDHFHAGGVEPHLWNSPTNARLITQNIYQALCQLDPDNKEFYTQNLNKVNREIEDTDKEIRELLSGQHDKAFLIYHPALSYYARDYGIHQICIEENGKEPSASHLKELADLCKQGDIRVVFIQKEFDTRNAELIAKEAGAQLISITPLKYEWKEELIQTTKALCHE